MGIFDWSKIGSSNISLEGSSWAEGMLPSAVNNGVRALAAGLKKWQEDTGGALASAGTAAALTLTTNSTLAALANGVQVAFISGVTNTGAATLDVDTRGAKSIRVIKDGLDVALTGWEIRSGGHYTVRYSSTANSAAGGWVLLDPTRSLLNHIKHYGAVGDGGAAVPTDDSAKFSAYFTAARASRDAVRKTHLASIHLGASAYHIASTIDATVIRSAYGSLFHGEGWLYGSTTGTPVIDFTGTSAQVISPINIYGSETAAAPSVGMLFQRYASAGTGDTATGPGAAIHHVTRPTLLGRFTKAAVALYAVEESLFDLLIIINDAIGDDAFGIIAEGWRTHTPESAFQADVSGARSFIQTTFSKAQVFCFRSTGWSITGITKGVTTTISYTVASGSAAPVNGDVIVIENAGQMTELANRVFTVASVDTGAGTFVLSGIDSTAYTTWTSGVGITWYRGATPIVISRASRLKLDDFYCASYGRPHIRLENPDNFGIQGLHIDMHGEGAAVSASIEFRCMGADLTCTDLYFRESGSQVSGNQFQVVRTGTEYLVLKSPKILVDRYNTVPAGPMFDHPEWVKISNGYIEVATAAYMNSYTTFAEFSGKIYLRDTDVLVEVRGDGHAYRGASPLRLQYDDDAASPAGPLLRLVRNSLTPANGDFLGAVSYRGNNSSILDKEYASVRGQVVSPTLGSEDGRVSVLALIAGTATEIIRIDGTNGLSMYGANPVIDTSRHHRLRSYTVATLPSATAVGQMIYVSDGATSKRMAVSDGTSWRWPDGIVVS